MVHRLKTTGLLLAALMASVAILAPASVSASLVTGVRLGLHPRQTRLVVDLDGEFSYRIERLAGNRIKIVFDDAEPAAGKRLSRRGLGLISKVKAAREGRGVALEVWLKGPARMKAFAWRKANRLVIDFRSNSKKERQKTASPARKKGPAEPKAAQPEKQTPAKRTARTETAPARDALGYLLGSERLTPQQDRALEKVIVAAPRPKRPGAPPGVAVDRAAAQAKSLALEAAGVERREDDLARQALAQAQDYAKRGYPEQALPLYEKAEKLGRSDEVARAALFGQADAVYDLNIKTGQPPFQDVERAYQKALGAYPRAPQAPRAMLRMGLVNYRHKYLARAKGFFNLLIKEHPDSAEAIEAQIHLAALLIEEGGVRRAVQMLRQVVNEHPDHPKIKAALWQLGRLLFDLGRFIEAYERFAKLMKLDPGFYLKEPLLLYYLGETAFRLEKMPEARRYLFWVLNIYPEVPDQDLIMARIGDTYRGESKYGKALAVYADVERRWPETDGALIARLRMAETSGRAVFGKDSPFSRLEKVFGIETTGDALTTYRQIAKEYPDRAVAQLARLKMGAWFYSRKEYLKAFETLKKLLADHPKTEFYRDAVYALRQSFARRMEQLDAERKPLKLIEFYEANKSLLPRQLQESYGRLLGHAYFELKLYGQAIEHYEAVLRRGKADAMVLAGLGEAYFKERRYDEAADVLSRFLAQYPAHGQSNRLRILLAKSLYKVKKYDRAAEAFRQAAMADPGGPDYWDLTASWADSLIQTKRYEAALELMARVLARAPKKADLRRRYLKLMGDAAMGLKRYDKAAEAYAAAVEGVKPQGENLAGFYRLGMAYLAAGKRPEAEKVFDRIIAAADPFWTKLAKDRLVVADVSAKLKARQEVANP